MLNFNIYILRLIFTNDTFRGAKIPSGEYSIEDDHHHNHGVEANNSLYCIKLSIVVDVEESRKYDHFPQTLQEDLQHQQSHQLGT